MIKRGIIYKLTLIILALGLVTIKYNKNEEETIKLETQKKTETQQNIEIQIGAVGDVMIHSPQLDAQYDKNTKTYNFDNNFEKVKSYIQNLDLSLANLETTLAGGEYTSYPQFNSPDTIITALQNTGFDIISTINNHTADKGLIGMTRTLDVIDNHELISVGTRKNTQEKNYEIKDIEGIKVGVIAYSYGEIIDGVKYLNGLRVPEELTDLTNVFDVNDIDTASEMIKTTLKEMESENIDISILSIHWGNEYSREPNDFQKQLAQNLCNEGLDIIIGSHPHVIQPFEVLKSEINEEHSTYCFYSLGNFISNQREELMDSPHTEDGVIPIITVEKNAENNETSIKEVEYIPTWTNKYYNEDTNKYVYEVLPILGEKDIKSYEDEIEASLTESIKDTYDIINKYTDEAKLYK